MKNKTVKIELIGKNQEVFSGITVKAGKKYYIISKSPFGNEIMVFACDSMGHCSNKIDLWHGFTFESAKTFLSTNQP